MKEHYSKKTFRFTICNIFPVWLHLPLSLQSSACSPSLHPWTPSLCSFSFLFFLLFKILCPVYLLFFYPLKLCLKKCKTWAVPVLYSFLTLSILVIPNETLPPPARPPVYWTVSLSLNHKSHCSRSHYLLVNICFHYWCCMLLSQITPATVPWMHLLLHLSCALSAIWMFKSRYLNMSIFTASTPHIFPVIPTNRTR